MRLSASLATISTPAKTGSSISEAGDGAPQRPGLDWTPAFAGVELMGLFDLIPHSSSAPAAVRGVSVQLDTDGHGTSVIYTIEASVDLLVIPSHAKPHRRDGLWRTTCVELFVGSNGGGYVELNFSPSREWAAYSFTSYRDGMAALEVDTHSLLAAPPTMWDEFGDGVIGYHLGVGIGPMPQDAQIGLSAVIEEIDGTKSYWALAHAPGPPDFHNPACFTATLPPPPRL